MSSIVPPANLDATPSSAPDEAPLPSSHPAPSLALVGQRGGTDLAQAVDNPAARYRRQLQAMTDVAWSIHSAVGIDAMLARILEHVTALVDADRSTFFIVDHGRGQLWSRVTQGHESIEIRLPVGAGVAGHVAETGRKVMLTDAYTDPRFDSSWDRSSGYRTRALLCVPITDREGRVVAVLQCLNKGGLEAQGAFDDGDAEALAVVGAQCAVALEKARLYDELKRQNAALQRTEAELRGAHEELALSYEVERHIAEASDEDALAASLLERLAELFQARAAGLLSLRSESGEWLLARSGATGLAQGATSKAEAQRWFERCRSGGAVSLTEDDRIASGSGESPFAADHVHGVVLHDEERPFAVLQLFDVPQTPASEHLLPLFDRVAARVARGLLRLRERGATQRAERLSLLGHSLSALVHDLRSPMAAVSGYVELLAMSEDDTERQDYVSRIERALAHIERMTEEVLAFARGQREVLIARVFLDGFAREVGELLRAETAQAGIELELDVRFDGAARFDAGKLTRVILNLARNACQAMGPGGTFMWRIDADDDHLVFECSDTGPGIAPEIAGRLFESFCSHGKEGGTGLGLAMAKRIIDAHDGEIECINRPGEGASFRIRLPR